VKKALVVGAALGVASSSEAATFNVTTNTDSGAGSLRQAILDANGAAGADTITFDAALSGSTITLTTGQMQITDSVDIQGPGSANLTIDANEGSRVFYVYNPPVAPLIEVTISGMTLTNGLSVDPSDPAASSGGAIRVLGENLALDDVNIQNNTAAGDGGGVAFISVDAPSSYNPVSAVLSIENSVISGNAANYVDISVPVDQGGCGGGVWAAAAYSVLLDNVTLSSNSARCDGGGFHAFYIPDGGLVTIQNSVITGNQAGLGGEGGSGGGVGFFGGYLGSDYRAIISNTTISGNTAPSGGGGIVAGYVAPILIERSTISGNTSSYGGGLGVAYSLMTIENSTIAQNTAYDGGGVYNYYSALNIKETTISGNTVSFDGAGIYATDTSTTGLINSIVAGNGAAADLYSGPGATFVIQNSLIQDDGGATITDNGGNLFGVDPQLGPLQDNGGSTFTMKPAATSVVVNAGDPAFTPPPSTDQRGLPRVAGPAIDMGSVELQPGTLQFSVAAQNASENAGSVMVTVTRTGGTDGEVSVFVGVDGSSTATGGGTDYTFPGAMMTFADGIATSQFVIIGIEDDLADEPAETIVLNLSLASGAGIGTPATHTVTIIDNDIVSDLSITKVLEPGSVTQGNNATFTLTITNNGPDAAPSVAVNDDLPPQLTLVSATPSSGTCVGTTNIVCNVGALNAGASATVTIIATMTDPGTATNIAAVSPTDANNANNSDTVTFTIQAAAAIPAVPALDLRMQAVLAALVAAIALGILGARRP
jgi:uncharacterized repeat protein (TIGR01451 family)